MTTIDKLDIGIYLQYARRSQLIEQVYQRYHLEEASSIPPQLQVVDFYPKPTEIDLLLGVVPRYTPWAYFFSPKKFRKQRRSPFAFHRVLPSLGSFDDQSEDFQCIEEADVNTAEEKREKEVLLSFFEEVERLNGWVGFIVGRIGQFLQG